METEVPGRGDVVTIGVHRLPVWPEHQKIENWQNSGVLVTRFDDHDIYAGSLRNTALERAADPKLSHQFDSEVGVGRAKAYDVAKWETDAATLINARAIALFRMAVRGAPAVVDMSWATIYRDGDFFMPHSHPRTLFSVLYVLDLGITEGSNNGRFFFVDPRLAPCCQQEKGYMNSPCSPVFEPGVMLLFPGQAVHFVSPYHGDKPRLTMSWDINKQTVEGSPLPNWVSRPG